MSGLARKFTLTQVVGDNLKSQAHQPSLVLSEQQQVIGRSERADYEVPVLTVSRRHAAVWMADGLPFIRDLGSGHGTFVNSTRIAEPTKLRQGDLVSLGQHVVFLLSAEESAEINALKKAQLAAEDPVDSGLVELALTDAAPAARSKIYLETLHKLLPTIQAVADEQDLLGATIEQLKDIITCDRFLGLVGETPETLKIVARKLRHPDDSAQWHPPSRSILRRAILSERPVISFDAQSDKRFRGRESITLANVRSAICVALRSEQGAEGVLYADTLATAGLHSIDDGNFMQLVGQIVGARLRALSVEQQLADLRVELDATSEAMVSGLTKDIKSHLNRLQLLADDAAEREQPDMARLLLAEATRLRDEIDRYIGWARQETTQPGVEEAPMAPTLQMPEDDQDRELELPPTKVEKDPPVH